jgi:hypothetical protein
MWTVCGSIVCFIRLRICLIAAEQKSHPSQMKALADSTMAFIWDVTFSSHHWQWSRLSARRK